MRHIQRVRSFGKTLRSFESGLLAKLRGLLVRLRVQSFGGITSPVFWREYESSLLAELRVQSFGENMSPVFWRNYESSLLARIWVQSFGELRVDQSFGEITSAVFLPDRTKIARKEAYIYKVLITSSNCLNSTRYRYLLT